LIPKWFSNFDSLCQKQGISTLINFDETSLFFELNPSHVLEVKGTKYIGVSSHAKSKERCTLIFTITNNGEKLPVCIILKTPKPKDKIYNDNSPSDFPTVNEETKKLIEKEGALILHSYSGWNSTYIMVKHFIPFLNKYLGNKYKKMKSLLLFDNLKLTQQTVLKTPLRNFK